MTKRTRILVLVAAIVLTLAPAAVAGAAFAKCLGMPVTQAPGSNGPDLIDGTGDPRPSAGDKRGVRPMCRGSLCHGVNLPDDRSGGWRCAFE